MKKISLSNLSKNAICNEEQSKLSGGHVCAQCWNDWVAQGKLGGSAREAAVNANYHTPPKSVDTAVAEWYWTQWN